MTQLSNEILSALRDTLGDAKEFLPLHEPSLI